MGASNLTDDDLRRAIAGAASYSDACRALGVNHYGGTYRKVRHRALALKLDTSHFNPFKRANSGGRHQKIPLTELLRDGVFYNSARLKQRLVEEEILLDECVGCGLGPEWNGKPLTLQLDHKNGKVDDNRIENLRILCPNCHTQTSTYGSKNSGRLACVAA